MKRSDRLKELEEEAILFAIERSLATQSKECEEEEEEEGEVYLSSKTKMKREREEAIQKKTLEDRHPSTTQEVQQPPKKKKKKKASKGSTDEVLSRNSESQEDKNKTKKKRKDIPSKWKKKGDLLRAKKMKAIEKPQDRLYHHSIVLHVLINSLFGTIWKLGEDSTVYHKRQELLETISSPNILTTEFM